MKALSHKLIVTALAAMALVPAANAGSGEGSSIWLDPALASAVGESSSTLWLDPALASAVRDSSSQAWLDPALASAVRDSSSQAWLDPSIASAVRDVASAGIAPDDRAGRRGQPPALVEVPAADGSFDKVDAGAGVGAIVGGLLLAGMLVFGRHHRRELKRA
jgi:hypothetical protein